MTVSLPLTSRGGLVEPGGAVSDCWPVDVVLEAVVVFGCKAAD